MSITVIVKSAITADGFMDKVGTGGGLAISSHQDSDAASKLRTWCDAIMVGAETVRRDRPRLLCRSDEAKNARVASGRLEHPTKCVVSRSGDFDFSSPFFETGDVPKYILGVTSNIAGLPDDVAAPLGLSDLSEIFEYLEDLGIKRLLVEGGPSLIGSLLAQNMVDEYRLAIAPMILGATGHANLGSVSSVPSFGLERLTLTGSELLGDTSVLYLYMPDRNHDPILPRIHLTPSAQLVELVKS